MVAGTMDKGSGESKGKGKERKGQRNLRANLLVRRLEEAPVSDLARGSTCVPTLLVRRPEEAPEGREVRRFVEVCISRSSTRRQQ